MSMRAYALSRQEETILDNVYGEIKRCSNTLERANRPSLRPIVGNLVKSLSAEPIARDELYKLLEKPSRRPVRHLAAAYDFAMEGLEQLLANRTDIPDEFCASISASLRRLEELRADRLTKSGVIASTLEDVFAFSGAVQKVPSAFSGEFFGYRRSSNKGDIIRFYLSIRILAGGSRVQFEGLYSRDGRHWALRGVGWLIRDTLYLCAHAREREDGNQSLGMRFLALRQFERTSLCLNGLVLSMDRDGGLIAARTFLVPLTEHKQLKTHERAAFTATDHSHITAMESFIDKEANLEDIERHIAHCFSVGKKSRAHYVFLESIRNVSVTVLKGFERDEDPAVGLEEDLREFCTENEVPYVKRIRELYFKKFIPLANSVIRGETPH